MGMRCRMCALPYVVAGSARSLLSYVMSRKRRRTRDAGDYVLYVISRGSG